MTMTIGELIRSVRKARKLSAEMLSRKCGVRADRICKIEARGSGVSTFERNLRILVALGFDLNKIAEDLLGANIRFSEAHELVPFLAIHADRHQRENGLNGLHPTHYDLMRKYGARMDDFRRATNVPATNVPGAPGKPTIEWIDF